MMDGMDDEEEMEPTVLGMDKSKRRRRSYQGTRQLTIIRMWTMIRWFTISWRREIVRTIMRTRSKV